jgi:hypothetical protein
MGTTESTIIVAFVIFMLLLVMILGFRKLSYFARTKGEG